jgi:sterol desaturase/sphingolipid hydroxylase (fatty acid hydroxylase superfamily)
MGILQILKAIQPYAVGLVFITIYLAEHVLPQRRELIDHKHDLFNFSIGVAGLLTVGASGFALQGWLSYCQSRHWGLLYGLPFWVKLGCGLLLADLFMYWWHWANHRIIFLWRFHKFHHSDTKLNSSSAVRFHIVELALSFVLKAPVFALLGINVPTVILYGLLLLPVTVLNHSNVRIGDLTDRFLRQFITSPHMHRLHHSVNVKETDSNYGAILPYWDRLFKSYTKPTGKNIRYGL